MAHSTPVSKESVNSPLLKNIQYQTYNSNNNNNDNNNNEIIFNKSRSRREKKFESPSPPNHKNHKKRKKNKKKHKNNSKKRKSSAIVNSLQNNDTNSSSFKIGIGRILNSCQSSIKYIVRLYNVLLFNSLIICLLLIISRIFDNKLFGSSIFVSNSEPLLLLANVTMMFSYSLSDYLLLRICLTIGCCLFSLWGITAQPLILLDTFFFNFVMCLLNLRHAILQLYKERYIAFNNEYEQIYINVFQPYLKRTDFLKLVNISYMRNVKKTEIFKCKGDEITSLCCLVNGRISVMRGNMNGDTQQQNIKQTNNRISISSHSSHSSSTISTTATEYLNDLLLEDSDIDEFLINPNFVNLVHCNQFIEAPQWVYANLKPMSDRFTVSFVAVDDCKYIKWPRENLINLIHTDSNIYNALQAVLGLHTAKALIKSREYTKIKHKRMNINILTDFKDNNNNNQILYDNNNDADIDIDIDIDTDIQPQNADNLI